MSKTILPAFPFVVDSAVQGWFCGHCEISSQGFNETETEFNPIFMEEGKIEEVEVAEHTLYNGLFQPFGKLFDNNLLKRYSEKKRHLRFNMKGYRFNGSAKDSDSSGLCAQLADIANLNYSDGKSRVVLFTGRLDGKPLNDIMDEDELVKTLVQKILYAAYIDKPIFLVKSDAEIVKNSDYCSQNNLGNFFSTSSMAKGLQYSEVSEVAMRAFKMLGNTKDCNAYSVKDDTPSLYLINDNLFENPNRSELLLKSLSLPKFGEKRKSKDTFRKLYEKLIPEMISYDVDQNEWENIRETFLTEQDKRTMRTGEDGLVDKLIGDEFDSMIIPGKGMPIEKFRHVLISGPTGTGKTELAAAILLNKILTTPSGEVFPNKGLYIGPIKALIEQVYKEFDNKFSKLLKPLLESRSKHRSKPIIISTGENVADDSKIRKNAENYSIACVVNEKANIFSTTETEYIRNLRCVVIDEVHMVNHAQRTALDLLIGKLKKEAERRITSTAREPALTLICITTEEDDFSDVLEFDNIPPFSLSTERRPIPSSHFLCIMPNTNMLAAQENMSIKDLRIQLADMKSNTERYKDVDSFNANIIKKYNVLLASKYANPSKDILENYVEEYSCYVNKIKNEFNGGKGDATSILICSPKIEIAYRLGGQLADSRQGEQHDQCSSFQEKLTEYANEVIKAGLPDERSRMLIELSSKGIFLHHSKMAANLKEFVQDLFSNKKIIDEISDHDTDLVVIATETLAYGINLSTDLLILLSYKFQRHNGMQCLSANEYHNILGRAGRYGLSKSNAEVYLCLPSIQGFSLAFERKDSTSKLQRELEYFLRAMYCRLPKLSIDGGSDEFRNERALRKNLSGLFINSIGVKNKNRTDLLTAILLEEESGRDYVMASDNYNADDFNRNLHSFLDAIWYYSSCFYDNEPVLLKEAIKHSLMSSFYINNDFVSSPFNNIVERINDYTNEPYKWKQNDYLRALLKVGYHVLGRSNEVRKESDENGEGQHSFIRGLDIVYIENTNPEEIKFQVTKSGESLLATGTHFKTAKAIELWIRILSDATKDCKSVPIELFLPALVYPDEVYVQFSNMLPELKIFQGKKNKLNKLPRDLHKFIDDNYSYLKNKLRTNFQKVLKNDVDGSLVINKLFDAIEYSLAGPIQPPKWMDEEVLKETKDLFSIVDGFNTPKFEGTNKEIILKLKLSAYYRSILICYMWINEESLSDIESVGCSINNKMFESIRDKRTREELIEKSKDVQEFSPNSGAHSQLIYKANNLINYFSGQKEHIREANKYSVMSKLNFNVSMFERRVRYGCLKCNLPIATALQSKWSRHQFCSNLQRNGYLDLFTMYDTGTDMDMVNGVEGYWKLLQEHFLGSFESLHHGLIRGLLDKSDDMQMAVVNLWDKYLEHLGTAVETPEGKTSFVSLSENVEFKELINKVHSNYFESPLESWRPILFHGGNGKDLTHCKISIYAYLVLIVLISRGLNKNGVSNRNILDLIESSGKGTTVNKLMLLDCWDSDVDSTVMTQLKNVTYTFDEPLSEKWLEE